MRTLAEPKQNIAKLWGKQTVKPEETYRLMRYVLRVDHEGKTALHNVVTGQLVVLDADEVQAVDALPAGYTPIMDLLIADHYLVPEDYDEHKQVVNLRTILRSMMPKSKYITNYTILPTTACNARCYYCFEQGVKPVTMTEHVAEDTVRFIAEHCGPEKSVSILWFGGEPTVAANRIDQICFGLQREGIAYSSMMYTNGYLFDEKMAIKAKDLWHVKHMQIVIDGTEDLYNRIKSYVNPQGSPYQRVMQNIGYLINCGISVSVRMNIDNINIYSFKDVVEELIARFKRNSLLRVCAYCLIGEYTDCDGNRNHADEDILAQKVLELNKYSRDRGMWFSSQRLPSITTTGCSANSEDCITISSTGKLIKCGEHFDDSEAVGTLKRGVTDFASIEAWKTDICRSDCMACAFMPNCVIPALCKSKDRCYKQHKICRILWSIEDILIAYLEKGGGGYGF